MLKNAKKQERALANLAKLLEQHGVKVDVQETKSYVNNAAVTESEKLEGVLASVRRPGDFTYRICKRAACGQPFGANYQSVAYCSDLCRIKDFEYTTGIKWNSNKSPEERWGGEPPIVIPPEVIATMLPYAKRIVESFHSLGVTEQELADSVQPSPLPVQDESPAESSTPSPKPFLFEYDFPEANFLQ